MQVSSCTKGQIMLHGWSPFRTKPQGHGVGVMPLPTPASERSRCVFEMNSVSHTVRQLQSKKNLLFTLKCPPIDKAYGSSLIVGTYDLHVCIGFKTEECMCVLHVCRS